VGRLEYTNRISLKYHRTVTKQAISFTDHESFYIENIFVVRK